MNERWKNWIAEHWLVYLIAAQPLLDAVAFWNRNAVATVAGYIRLVILLALPLYLLVTLKDKRRLLLALTVMGAYCVLHILNGFRVGYISLYFDVSYLVKVIQMPVLAVCFVYLIRSEQTKRQALKGIVIAAVLVGFGLILAYLTGTGNVTYGEGLGYSGWVINDNRCAHAIILVTLSVCCAYLAVESSHILPTVVVPVLITIGFITNGTKSCYYSIFAVFGALTAYLLLERPIRKEKLKGPAILVLVALMIFSVVIYPYTPRARVTAKENTAYQRQGEIEAAVEALGYDVTQMTPQERFDNEEVREVFAYYYYRYFIGVLPDIFDRFGMDRVLLHYDMTTDVYKLINTRVMKIAYSDMIWEDSDALTKLVGFEVSEIGFDGTHDLENDWPAMLYYYGYLGLALYVLFILYFLYLVLRRLLRAFRESYTAINFTLLLCLALQLGLAQFSGAILRRPNVSIYLSLVLALIYYQTVRLPRQSAADGEEAEA
ncbi:MAG: O-antigen ligase family protein [Oscillospiraceae bacterium]|nr:O-antigen ligase family protein [Oscillospiraceae bacterium]